MAVSQWSKQCNFENIVMLIVTSGHVNRSAIALLDVSLLSTLMNYEWIMRAWRYMASVCIVTESTIRSVCLKSKPILPLLTDDLRPYRGQAPHPALEGCIRVITGVSWKSLNYLSADPWVIVELFRSLGAVCIGKLARHFGTVANMQLSALHPWI